MGFAEAKRYPLKEPNELRFFQMIHVEKIINKKDRKIVIQYLTHNSYNSIIETPIWFIQHIPPIWKNDPPREKGLKQTAT